MSDHEYLWQETSELEGRRPDEGTPEGYQPDNTTDGTWFPFAVMSDGHVVARVHWRRLLVRV